MSGDAQKAWIQHAGGSSRLIYCRGPSRFDTDFECAMFHAQVAPMVMYLLDSAQTVIFLN